VAFSESDNNKSVGEFRKIGKKIYKILDRKMTSTGYKVNV
jgi:hypothetical protein